jgi:hypothetical protein
MIPAAGPFRNAGHPPETKKVRLLADFPRRMHTFLMGMNTLSTHDKALRINIDAARYGTFAEIGAGQEVARWFFHVGGAAGTVAKTISAYDMAVSDAVYGPGKRYVSRQRLQAMLDHEWTLLLERLNATRGGTTKFFVFADTVTAKSYSRQEEGQGWLGIRFQAQMNDRPSEIIIHARMWDQENARQQEALGILGVNLIHGAFYHHDKPPALIGSLMDELTRDRMEVDMIKLSGPAFDGVDNRLASLQLVQQRLTNAALFSPDGEVVEPAELLYHAPLLIERGSFRPVTRVALDMMDRSLELMRGEPDGKSHDPVVLMEMTLRNLLTLDEQVDHADFLARMDTLRALGRTVMVSNYSRFHNVTGYLRRYTQERIGMVLGVPTLAEIFEEKYYEDLGGGLLEALGRLLAGPVRLYIYPWRNPDGEKVTAETCRVPSNLFHLYTHLLTNGYIRSLEASPGVEIAVLPRTVRERIRERDSAWETLVPPEVVKVIRERGLFGYRSA